MKLLVLVLAIFVTGCGGTAGQSTSAATVDELIQPSASPSAESGRGALCAQGFEPCSLEAGTYSAAPFAPNFSFTIGDAWQNDRAFVDGGGISREMGGIIWASGVSHGTVGREEVAIGASPDDFVAFLQSLKATGMTVSEPTSATVDGATGQQLDVESNDVEAPGLYFIAEDTFLLVPDEKVRFIVLDKDGTTVLFILESYKTADFAAWLDTSQPVVDSISWE